MENSKAVINVLAEAHIHPGFVKLELRPRSAEQPRHGDIDRDLEVKRQVRANRKTIDLSDPARRDAADYVAGECRLHIAVGEHDHAGLERRQDFMKQPAGEIRGVEQAEGRRREALVLFAFLSGVPHKFG